MCILGIETSCDDTGLALFDEKKGLLGHVLFSQLKTHQAFGGVVPELASRDHSLKLLPLLNELLAQCACSLNDISAIAYTKGPGLIGSLMVGACFARTLGFALNIPTLGIHHMEGHLLAVLLEEDAPSFPFVSLLVSGGHTQLIEVTDLGQYKILGETLDDAAGEAFDKTAKLLGLGYPGGPLLQILASKGDASRFDFPRPLTEKAGLDFSFSGLKTFTMNTYHQTEKTEQDKADIAAAFQEAVVDTLYIKCKRALKQTGHQNLVIAGGVGANILLRKKLKSLQENLNVKVFFPRLEFCTDNGAMIAIAGFHRLKLGQKDGLEIDVKPRWMMDQIAGFPPSRE